MVRVRVRQKKTLASLTLTAVVSTWRGSKGWAPAALLLGVAWVAGFWSVRPDASGGATLAALLAKTLAGSLVVP